MPILLLGLQSLPRKPEALAKPDSDLQKKQLIVILLFLACMASAMLLASAKPPSGQKLESLDVVDRAINSAFMRYGVPESRITAQIVNVDSLFSRVSYRAEVPSGFPSTAFHLALAGSLAPYGIVIHGERHFPERRLDLKMHYAGKQIRTVRVQIVRNLE